MGQSYYGDYLPLMQILGKEILVIYVSKISCIVNIENI